MQKLLKKIFQSPNRRRQTWFAGLGFALGLLLLMVSGQFYLQISRLIASRQAYSDYLIVSKKINYKNTFFLSRVEFSEKEIKNLQKQDFVEDVGSFLSNQFEVLAYSRGQLPFHTELFFESVPPQFLDLKPEFWEWSESSEFVPVILSQDMLNLYNFGFALAKGLPQLPASAMQKFTVNLRIRGPQGQRTLQGKIVGFSERIPSVIVPKSFMEWANTQIGENKKLAPSRLIVKVNNPADPKLAQYLKREKLQTNQDRLGSSRIGGLIQVALSAIGLIGLAFVGLSILVFSLTFRLSLSEARQEINMLLQLGYTPQIITRFLGKNYLFLMLLLTLITSGGAYYLITYLQEVLRDQGLSLTTGMLPEIFVLAFFLFFLTVALNLVSIFQLLSKQGRA